MCTTLRLIRTEAPSEARAASRVLVDEMVVFYAGAMHDSRGLSYMFDAVSGVEGVRLKVAGPITTMSGFLTS